MCVGFCAPIAHCPQTDHGRCSRAYCSVPAHSPRPCSGSTARPLPPLTCLCPKGRVHPAPNPRWPGTHRLSTCSSDFPNVNRSATKTYTRPKSHKTQQLRCVQVGPKNQGPVHIQSPTKHSTCDVYRSYTTQPKTTCTHSKPHKTRHNQCV